VSNPLKDKYFVRRASCVFAIGVLLSCGGKKKVDQTTPQ